MAVTKAHKAMTDELNKLSAATAPPTTKDQPSESESSEEDTNDSDDSSEEQEQATKDKDDETDASDFREKGTDESEQQAEDDEISDPNDEDENQADPNRDDAAIAPTNHKSDGKVNDGDAESLSGNSSVDSDTVAWLVGDVSHMDITRTSETNPTTERRHSHVHEFEKLL